MKARTVVVGFDGSVDARKALDAAIDHAAPDGMVHVVTAYDEATQAELARVLAELPAEFRGTFDASATASGHLRDAERVLTNRHVPHCTHLVPGRPAAAILDVASDVDADLVVVGSRGLGRMRRFLRGSVSSRIAGHATTSVMIVHHEVDDVNDAAPADDVLTPSPG